MLRQLKYDWNNIYVVDVFMKQLRLDHDFYACEPQGYDSIPSTIIRHLLLNVHRREWRNGRWPI
jgi:hypothetical protein